LIRDSALYKKSGVATDRVPSANLVKDDLTADTTKTLLVLGTTFLKNVYVYFDTNDHTVSLAEAIHVEPSSKHIDSEARGWFLGLGTVATIALVAALLVLLTKVPYTPSTKAALPAPLVRLV